MVVITAFGFGFVVICQYFSVDSDGSDYIHYYFSGDDFSGGTAVFRYFVLVNFFDVGDVLPVCRIFSSYIRLVYPIKGCACATEVFEY